MQFHSSSRWQEGENARSQSNAARFAIKATVMQRIDEESSVMRCIDDGERLFQVSVRAGQRMSLAV